MCLYGSLWVFVSSYGFGGCLVVLMSPYGSRFLWVLMGHRGFLWVLKGHYWSLCVLIGSHVSLWVFMGLYYP